jgi:hypothetical protein
MNIFNKNVLLCFLAYTIIQSVCAQTDSTISCISCICEKDATPAGVMISHVHAKGEWMLSYRYMNMESRGMQLGTSSISNDQIYNQYLMSSDEMSMGMHMLMAMYGISRRLTLMTMFEYNVSKMNMIAPEGSGHVHPGATSPSSSHDMSTSGFGDVSVTALYSIINSKKHHVLISGGLSIPTGSIQKTGNASSMYPNKRYPYMMQEGSGTWDVMPGLTYTFKGGNVMASSQILSTIRTGYNSVGYQLGNEVVFNNWVAYQFKKWISSSLRLEAMHVGAMNGYDPDLYTYSEPSANAANYGGTNVSLNLGLNTYFLGSNKIAFEVGVPLYQNSIGIQPSQYYNVHIMYSIVF